MDERVYSVLEYDKILKKLSELTVTELGRRGALALRPQYERRRVEKMLAETAEAESILLGNAAYPISSYSEVSYELTRLKMGASLSCGEMLKTAGLLKAAKKAASSVKHDDEKNIHILPETAEGLFYDDALISAIERSIESEDMVYDDASAELKSIRRRIKSENELIRERLNGIIRSSENSKYLQEALITIRNGRYVVPVKQENRSRIKGVVHGQSASGATLFIEPMSVLEANNRISELKDAERHEIERILAELSARLAPYIRELEWDQEILSYLDIIFAKASLAVKMKASRPKLFENRELAILKGRHPLIPDGEAVPVTLELDSSVNSLIITGPNTGGKTVTLKLAGIFALMAQSGMFLPAEEGTGLPVFREVYADIGDEQSIEQSLSTFSSHMKNIVKIIEEAGQDSLVLLDELGAGTDPEEGAALAMAVLKDLSARGLTLFATTHYSEIKSFALTAKGFLNASMEFDVNTLSPTFRLITGVSGSSNALLISAGLGLPGYIISSAKSLMNKERLRFDELMLEAEKTKKRAEAELEEAERIQRQAVNAAESAKKAEIDLDEKEKRIIDGANKEAYEIVLAARKEAEEIISELKKVKSAPEGERTKAIEKGRKKLSAKKAELEKSIVPRTPREARHVEPSALKLGDSVRIISLNADATVNKLPDAKGMVGVTAGIMNMNIHYTDLSEPKSQRAKKAERTSRVTRAVKPVKMSLNITGCNVEEAYMELDKYMDDAYLSGLTEVSIIHGKGTGVLRAAVHTYLKKHPHVKTFRLGRFGEGEDGVTLVTFK